MATTLKLKNSVTTTAAPSSLVQGEAAVNITDKKVWVGDAASSPVQILGAGAPVAGTTLTMTADGTFSGTGQLKVPAGTTAQRSGSPAAGMIRYNSSTGGFEGYTTAWGSIGGGATGAGGDTVFQENSRTVTTSYTLTSGKSASCVGPITINSGATLTIPSGERLVIL
jgi:hypothetical protein